MTKTVGFIGSGNMASAIISGILKSGTKLSLMVYDLYQANYETLAQQGVRTCADSSELVCACDTIFLSIKPQNFGDVLPEIKPHINKDAVIVSIAAGITDTYIASELGYDAKVVLVMPNTPLLLGAGATALAKGERVSEEEFEFVRSLFDLSGETAVIAKDKMKEIISVNGSTPAYIYLFAKGFVDYAKQTGIDEQTALRLFCAPLKGSAEMMLHSGRSIDELIKMVSSPGGTTLAGLEVFEQNDLLGTIHRSCEACTKRAYELSK